MRGATDTNIDVLFWFLLSFFSFIVTLHLPFAMKWEFIDTFKMVCRRWKSFIRVNELHTFVCLLVSSLSLLSLFLFISLSLAMFLSYLSTQLLKYMRCDEHLKANHEQNEQCGVQTQSKRSIATASHQQIFYPANSFPLFILFIRWHYFALTRPWFSNVGRAVVVICALCARLCIHSLHFMHLLNREQCLWL